MARRSRASSGVPGCATPSDPREQLGGGFRSEQGTDSLRAVLELPYVASRRHGSASLTLAGQIADGREASLRVLRAATAAQNLFTLLSVTPRQRLRGRLLLLAGLLTAGEASERLPDDLRAGVQALLARASMTAVPGEGRPPTGGWSSVMCATAGSRHHPRWGVRCAGRDCRGRRRSRAAAIRRGAPGDHQRPDLRPARRSRRRPMPSGGSRSSSRSAIPSGASSTRSPG